MKQTPLYEKHLALGARLIDFGGWELPVQYTGILEEHQQVRKAAGLFDVSHMGEITLRGPGATEYLDRLLTNRVGKAAIGQDRPADTKAAAAGPLVNLNTAPAEQLERLPGVGPKTAARIIEYRQKSGGFKKIEELMNVRGIGEKAFLKMKPQLTVAPPKVDPQ